MLILLFRYVTLTLGVAILNWLTILLGLSLLLEIFRIKVISFILKAVLQAINGLFKSFSKLLKRGFSKVIQWIFQKILNLISLFFSYCKKVLEKIGVSNELMRNILATLITIIVILIII